jgi:hypothetical protein
MEIVALNLGNMAVNSPSSKQHPAGNALAGDAALRGVDQLLGAGGDPMQ